MPSRCAAPPVDGDDTATLAVGMPLPRLVFSGLSADGLRSAVDVHELSTACDDEARTVVLRVTAGFCGTCKWHVSHTREWMVGRAGDGLRLIDVVVSNDQNATPDEEDLRAIGRMSDWPHPVVADSEFVLRALAPEDARLPFYVFVDAETLAVTGVASDPSPATLAYRLDVELARAARRAAPVYPSEELFDGRFNREQWDLIRDMRRPLDPPRSPTNAFADDPRAAALGKALYFSEELAPGGGISCSTCHDPANDFASLSPVSIGRRQGDRNGPSVLFASHERLLFWDGRADSLWMQALGPIENPNEYDSTRLYLAHAIADRYRADYEAIFGPLPPLGDSGRFPASGKPGDATWEAMRAEDKRAVNRVFANFGKAVEAYERTLRAKPTAFDAYVAGDLAALSPAAKDGLLAFFASGCAQCHFGPRLTDDAFHALRFPTGRRDGAPDRGRIDGIAPLLASEFRVDGPFSDAPTLVTRRATAEPRMLGAFKTPGLRGIPSTGPYGHGGTFKTLDDVVRHYATAARDVDDDVAVGELEPWATPFGDAAARSIPEFLKVLIAHPE